MEIGHGEIPFPWQRRLPRRRCSEWVVSCREFGLYIRQLQYPFLLEHLIGRDPQRIRTIKQSGGEMSPASAPAPSSYMRPPSSVLRPPISVTRPGCNIGRISSADRGTVPPSRTSPSNARIFHRKRFRPGFSSLTHQLPASERSGRIPARLTPAIR